MDAAWEAIRSTFYDGLGTKRNSQVGIKLAVN